MHIDCYGFKAFQNKQKISKTDGGHEKKLPDQQKDNDKDKDKGNDSDHDKYI